MKMEKGEEDEGRVLVVGVEKGGQSLGSTLHTLGFGLMGVATLARPLTLQL